MRKKFSIIGMVVCSLIVVFGIIIVCAQLSDKTGTLMAVVKLSGISGFRMIGFGLFGICLFGALMETPKTAPVINIPQINTESRSAKVPEQAPKENPEMELKAQDVAREMQAKMGGISEVSPMPAAEKPSKREINTLPEMLAYAGKFSSDSGMMEYMNREKGQLAEEDRMKVDALLSLPPKEIRESIKKMTEEA